MRPAEQRRRRERRQRDFNRGIDAAINCIEASQLKDAQKLLARVRVMNDELPSFQQYSDGLLRDIAETLQIPAHLVSSGPRLVERSSVDLRDLCQWGDDGGREP